MSHPAPYYVYFRKALSESLLATFRIWYQYESFLSWKLGLKHRLPCRTLSQPIRPGKLRSLNLLNRGASQTFFQSIFLSSFLHLYIHPILKHAYYYPFWIWLRKSTWCVCQKSMQVAHGRVSSGPRSLYGQCPPTSVVGCWCWWCS
jgi:hypothetical protein